MSYAPCKNQNCNSFGKPHPNCRCWGELSQGGEAQFCSQDRAHDSGCQYFAYGSDDIEPDNIEVDQHPEEIPENQIEVDQPASQASPEAIPEDQIEIDQSPEDEGVHTTEPPPDQRVATTPDPGDVPTVPGGWLTPNVMKKTAQDYEEAFGVGSLITGGGAVGLAGKAATSLVEAAGIGRIAEAANEVSRLQKIGVGAIKGMITNGLIGAGDEASKMLTGDNPHSFSDAVGSVLIDMGLGGILGAGAPALSAGATKMASELKAGTKATNFVNGFASAAESVDPKARAESAKLLKKAPDFDAEAHKKGEEIYDLLVNKVIGGAPKAAALEEASRGAYQGYEHNGLVGAATGAAKGAARGYAAGSLSKYFGGKALKVSTPVILKILSSGTTSGFLDALNHAQSATNGLGKVDDAMESLFGGAARGADAAVDRREKIEKWAEGGPDNDLQHAIWNQNAQPVPAFAEGGEVKPHAVHQETGGIAAHFPEQNILMNAAKARTANYLSMLKPQENPPRLAFDTPPDNRDKKRSYNRALDVAASPLSVIDKIRDGSITPDHLKHLNAMFPEVNQLLQRKATERISKAQIDGEKPSYKVRQGLSLLLGTPLSSELAPQNIAAAQAVFATKKAQIQAPPGKSGKTQHSSSALSKSDKSYLTADQARESRQQRQS